MKRLFALSLFAVILAIPAQAQNTPLKDFDAGKWHMKYVDGPDVNITISHSITDDGAKYDGRSFTQEYSGSALLVEEITYESVRDESSDMKDKVIASSFSAIQGATTVKTYANENWSANGLSGREGSEGIEMGGKGYFVVERVYVSGKRCYIIGALIAINSKLSGSDVRKIFDSFEVE